MSQKIPHNEDATLPGSPLVQVPNDIVPIFGNGVFQLPKNNTAPNILTNNIIPYSASIITAHRKPLYSV